MPTICAVNGAAIGAGLGVALACDMRVAAKKAKLGLTFVGLGIHPGMGTTHFLPQIAGPETASRLLLSGDLVSGEQALQLGVVSEVAEDGAEALEKAMAMAQRIAKGAPLAVSSCLATLRDQTDGGTDSYLQAALLREATAQAICYASNDFKEGVQAVAQKRDPAFSGE